MCYKTMSSDWIIRYLFIFFIFHFVVTVQSLGVPFIQPITFPNDVVKGQSVTITCAVSAGTGTFSFRWSKDGQPLTDQPLSRIQTFEEYSLLHLKSVDSSRSGNYTCYVINAVGTANYTAELAVFEQPEWDVLPEDVEVVYGQDTIIDCSAVGVPTPKVTWKKVQTSESSSPLARGHHRILNNGSLLLLDVQTADGGEYECVLSNGIGDDLRKQVTVLVHVPPQFHETQVVQNARSGHSAVLRCDVSGDSPIHIQWTKEFMNNKDSRYKIQETPLPNGLLSELYISRVVREDAGSYICSATNNYGKHQKTIKLVVLEPPASPSDVAVRQVERSEATVQWKAPYAGNSPIKHYIVQYWRDTGSPPKLLEELVNSEKTSHVLKSLRPGMSYLVRVIAENEFGSSTPSVPFRFSTSEDAPSGYPTDLNVFSSGRHELIVRWKAPAPDQRNGAIQGYELGYRKHHSLAPYVYREARLGPSTSQEFVLDNLEEDTEYEVVVRAHNSAGKGPTSMPVVGKTKEKGNLMSPMLWVEGTSATTLTLKWSGNEDVRRSDLRHTLHYRAEGKKWEEKTIQSSHSGSYVLSDLEENTLYYLYLQAITGTEQSNPSMTVTVRTSDPSFERSSMTQIQEVSHQTTLVISLSVVISCVVIVCVIAGACVYVTRVTSHANAKRDGHALSDFAEQPSTSRSTPLSRHTSNFRYVDVNSRPLLWCSTPAPPNDYPSPYATLPLRPTPMSKRWMSEDGMSPAVSERSESLINQRIEIPDDKISVKVSE